MSNKLKIYTKEQVIEILQHHVEFDHLYPDADDILEDYPPIELPSDEDIEANAKYNPTNGLKWNPIMKITWVEGAKWMRDKIQGGNNEQ